MDKEFVAWFDKYWSKFWSVGPETYSREEAEEIAFAAWQAAEQNAHPTPPTSRTEIALGMADLVLKKNARKSAPTPKPETFQEVIEYKRLDFVRSVIRAWSLDEAITIANKRLPRLLAKRNLTMRPADGA